MPTNSSNSALWLLAGLRFKGGLRKLGRTLVTPKGALLTLFTLSFFGFMILPQFLIRQTPIEQQARIELRDILLNPASLLGMWLFSMMGASFRSPIAFTLSEVEFLFAGPFTRRWLLLYKLSISVFGLLSFALLMPVFTWSFLTVWWPAAFLGMWLLLVFIQLTTVAMALGIDRLGASAPTWRWVAIGLLAAFTLAALWQSGALAPGQTINERLKVFTAGPVMEVVASPFALFSRLMRAETGPALATWSAAVLGANLAAVLLILRLDANFLEASVAASQKRYELIERAVRSGGMPVMGVSSKPRWSLPEFPRLWGAGPVAWRQLLHLARGSSRLMLLAPALVGPLVPMFVIQRNPAPEILPIVFMTLFIGFMIANIVPLGLRTDLDHIDSIKTLPISNAAIVWGSIASAVVYPTAVQLLVAATVTILLPRMIAGAALALAFALPMNLLLVAADSILVLFFPGVRRFTPGDVLIGARVMLLMMVKIIFLLVTGGVAASIAFLVYRLAGDRPVAGALAGWLVLVVEGIATVLAAALLFGRFDPSSDNYERE